MIDCKHLPGLDAVLSQQEVDGRSSIGQMKEFVLPNSCGGGWRCWRGSFRRRNCCGGCSCGCDWRRNLDILPVLIRLNKQSNPISNLTFKKRFKDQKSIIFNWAIAYLTATVSSPSWTRILAMMASSSQSMDTTALSV